MQLFGEGFDYPALDSVLFAENMNSSIRIIQSGLRPCRIDPENPDKIGKILIPIFDHQDTKVKQVLMKMKEIDGEINSKICISEFDNLKKSSLKCRKTYHNNDVNSDIRKLLEKINVEYLCEDIGFTIDDIKGSTIVKCKINDVKIENKQYRSIFINILNKMKNEDIINMLNIPFSKKIINDKGYKWYSNLEISIQGCDAYKTLKEIRRLCVLNNFKLYLKIKKKNTDLIEIDF